MHRDKDTTTIKIETNPLFFYFFITTKYSYLASYFLDNIRKAVL
jgi:hypothetical protein